MPPVFGVFLLLVLEEEEAVREPVFFPVEAGFFERDVPVDPVVAVPVFLREDGP